MLSHKNTVSPCFSFFLSSCTFIQQWRKPIHWPSSIKTGRWNICPLWAYYFHGLSAFPIKNTAFSGKSKFPYAPLRTKKAHPDGYALKSIIIFPNGNLFEVYDKHFARQIKGITKNAPGVQSYPLQLFSCRFSPSLPHLTCTYLSFFHNEIIVILLWGNVKSILLVFLYDFVPFLNNKIEYYPRNIRFQ